jgi:hypothetical protein
MCELILCVAVLPCGVNGKHTSSLGWLVDVTTCWWLLLNGWLMLQQLVPDVDVGSSGLFPWAEHHRTLRLMPLGMLLLQWCCD